MVCGERRKKKDLSGVFEPIWNGHIADFPMRPFINYEDKYE